MFDLDSEDITDGSLLRALLFLAAPLLIQNLVQVLQQVIDLFWLGRLSSDAVAAVGLALPVIALLFALVIYAPFVGTQVLVSQRIGGSFSEGLVLAFNSLRRCNRANKCRVTNSHEADSANTNQSSSVGEPVFNSAATTSYTISPMATTTAGSTQCVACNRSNCCDTRNQRSSHQPTRSFGHKS